MAVRSATKCERRTGHFFAMIFDPARREPIPKGSSHRATIHLSKDQDSA